MMLIQSSLIGHVQYVPSPGLRTNMKSISHNRAKGLQPARLEGGQGCAQRGRDLGQCRTLAILFSFLLSFSIRRISVLWSVIEWKKNLRNVDAFENLLHCELGLLVRFDSLLVLFSNLTLMLGAEEVKIPLLQSWRLIDL